MGFKINYALAFVGLMALIVGVALFVNVVVFCKDRTEIDFELFTLDCSKIPNKQAELDDVLGRACYIHRTEYNCNAESIEKVVYAYAEFGKQSKNYTLLELCTLKNQFAVTELQCSQLCGCRY